MIAMSLTKTKLRSSIMIKSSFREDIKICKVNILEKYLSTLYNYFYKKLYNTMKLSLHDNKSFFNNFTITCSVRYGCLNLIVV